MKYHMRDGGCTDIASELPQAEKSLIEFRDHSGSLVQFADRFVIYNKRDSQPFGTVRSQYHIAQHIDILAGIEKTIRSIPEFGMPEVSIDLDPISGRMDFFYKFDDIQERITSKVGDYVCPVIKGWNSLDGTSAAHKDLGGFQKICANGQIMLTQFYSVHKRHVKNPITDFFMEGDLKNAMFRFSKQTDLWRTWVDKHATSELYQHTMQTMKAREEEIAFIDAYLALIAQQDVVHKVDTDTQEQLPYEVELPVVTQWALYNAFTWLITHEITSRTRRMQAEASFRNALDKGWR